MIVYLVEFVLLHTLFFIVYKIFLSNETQLRFLRFFLIGSTLSALIIPLIEIPSSSTIPTFNLEGMIVYATETIPSASNHAPSIPWFSWLLGMVSTFIFIKFLTSLIKIVWWYKKSTHDNSYEFPIRKIPGIKNSFTFFRWIFIDPDHFENPIEIIKHEWGHSRQLHSLDILFVNLLSILFWWVPTIWLVMSEMRKVHEYEADEYALTSINQNIYIKTLVHSTLKAHGLNLASSFDDAPIVKRLNFIKMIKKKISLWKVGSIMAIVIISGAMFACQEELDSEIQRIAEESNQQIIYSDQVQAALEEAMLKYPDIEFAVVETLLENEESIKKLKKYDPTQIERMFVIREEGNERVVMIISKDSKVFEKAIHVSRSGENFLVEYQDGSKTGDKLYTIVEESPMYPGGKKSLHNFLSSTRKYPVQAQKLGVEGRVYVEFVVEKDGSVTNAIVVKGIGAGCDAEALRVIESSPDWIAGKQGSEIVRTKVVLPVDFTLN